MGLRGGYRHIDTASIYKNEEGVGQGIKESGVDRKDIFVVSKVWNSDQGYESTIKAFETSLKRLDLDYLDLYLVHWPVKGNIRKLGVQWNICTSKRGKGYWSK